MGSYHHNLDGALGNGPIPSRLQEEPAKIDPLTCFSDREVIEHTRQAARVVDRRRWHQSGNGKTLDQSTEAADCYPSVGIAQQRREVSPLVHPSIDRREPETRLKLLIRAAPLSSKLNQPIPTIIPTPYQNSSRAQDRRLTAQLIRRWGQF
jgi:hypothetical protein